MRCSETVAISRPDPPVVNSRWRNQNWWDNDTGGDDESEEEGSMKDVATRIHHRSV